MWSLSSKNFKNCLLISAESIELIKAKIDYLYKEEGPDAAAYGPSGCGPPERTFNFGGTSELASNLMISVEGIHKTMSSESPTPVTCSELPSCAS